MFVKNTGISGTPEHYKSGTLAHWARGLSDQRKIMSVNNFLEGSVHQNFVNPFEYGKSFLGKLLPK